MCADGVYPGLVGEAVGSASKMTASAGDEKSELTARPPYSTSRRTRSRRSASMESARAAVAYAGGALHSASCNSTAAGSVTTGLNNSKIAKW